MADSLNIDLDFRSTGQVLEALARRLLYLERLDPGAVSEDEFADSKNDALALVPLYRELRHRAVETFGLEILRFSPAIAEIDALYAR